MLNAIGIPVVNTNKEVTERNDTLVKAAFLYGVPVYIYEISGINVYKETGQIPALYWNNGEYHKCMIDLPKYTEVCCSTNAIKRLFPSEVGYLLENTKFTDMNGLIKYKLQCKMLLSELSQYAIPTILIHSYEELLISAKMFPSSFLKPAGGRKAKGAMRLDHKDGALLYSTPEGSGVLSKETFVKYYSDAGYQENSPLLLEPCLNILNDEGRAVDFRCLVSLNGEGKWQNVLTYARIGGSGVASNFSHGGSLNFAEDVLEMLIPGHGAEKLEEINRVALKVAEFVQKEAVNPVSWLGLDICVDRPSNQIYVIEANSKPGTKLVGPWPLSLVRAQYYKYLLSQSDTEKK